MKPIRRVLMIRLSALGDICMTLPVIDSACRAYPNVEFTLLTSKVGALVAQSVMQRQNLHLKAINKADYKGLGGLNRLYRELAADGYDAVADMHDVLRTQWVRLRFWLAGCPVVCIDKGRSEKKALVAHSIMRQLKTGIERYRQVLAKLGMNFEVDYDAAQAAKALAVSSDDAPAIGIAPFAQHQGKVYPAKLMRQMIDTLCRRRPDVKVYLFGSRDEQSVLDVWAAAHPTQVTCLAGRQSIADDLRTMAGLKLMLSMDSANMHMASLVGLRCLSVWGATHRYAGFLGWQQREEDCIELDMPCRPCSVYGNKPCHMGDFPCLNGIDPTHIAQRIIDNLPPAPCVS